MSNSEPGCIFCRIVSGEIPAKVVARSDHALAFHDLTPKAPVHVLIIPLSHLGSAAEATGGEGEALLGQVMRLAVETAAQLGLAGDGYRLVINTGPNGGQSVGHLHVHLLGGRQMHWPPG
jgi:histidine triad (HIT) family protein